MSGTPQWGELRDLASDEGIDLPDDPETRKYLRAIQIHKAWESRENDKDRKDRRWWWTKVFALATAALGAAGVTYTQVRPKPVPRVDAVDVRDTVSSESKVIRREMELNTKRIEKLAEIAVEQQETTVEAVGYIGDKIEAAHPRQLQDLQAVPEPEALTKAKASVQDRKRKAAAGKLLEIDTGP